MADAQRLMRLLPIYLIRESLVLAVSNRPKYALTRAACAGMGADPPDQGAAGGGVQRGGAGVEDDRDRPVRDRAQLRHALRLPAPGATSAEDIPAPGD